MCGRFTQTYSPALIAKAFKVDKALINIIGSYNIAPTQLVTAIINHGSACFSQLRWGLIPSWAKDLSIGNKMINARSETLNQKPSFKIALKKRRCLIVADGFYEWKKKGNFKEPFYIRLKSRQPFGFAGLYDSWKSPEGKEIKSCAIITTEANELIKSIHHRMPVIIPKNKEDDWLKTNIQEPSKALAILKPYASDHLEYFQVSKFVNSPKNNSPQCVEPA